VPVVATQRSSYTTIEDEGRREGVDAFRGLVAPHYYLALLLKDGSNVRGSIGESDSHSAQALFG
jgi:hypothetical protein